MYPIVDLLRLPIASLHKLTLEILLISNWEKVPFLSCQFNRLYLLEDRRVEKALVEMDLPHVGQLSLNLFVPFVNFISLVHFNMFTVTVLEEVLRLEKGTETFLNQLKRVNWWIKSSRVRALHVIYI